MFHLERINAHEHLGLPDDNSGNISSVLNSFLGSGADGLRPGSTLVFPPGTYRALEPIIQMRDVNVVVMGGAQILGVLSDPDHDLWRVQVRDGLTAHGAESRHMTMGGGGRIEVAPGMQGRHALSIGDGTTLAAFNTNVHDLWLTGAGINDGRGLYVTGHVGGADNGPTFSKFDNLSCNHGAHLDGIADGTVFQNGQVFGNYGLTVDIVEGGYCTRIANNHIGSQGLDVLNASQILIENNQLEVKDNVTSGLELGGVTCQMALRGTARTIGGATVRNNNFGGGVGRVDIPLIVDDCVAGDFYENKHNPGTTGVDIRLTAAAMHNLLARNRPRGARDGQGYNDRPDLKMRIQDFGEGNMGVHRYVPDLELSTATYGWRSAEAYVMKDAHGTVRFEGRLQPGSIMGGEMIFRLPLGFRPVLPTRLMAPTNIGTSYAILTVAQDGAVRFGGHTGDAPAQIYLDGLAMQAPAQHNYRDIK